MAVRTGLHSIALVTFLFGCGPGGGATSEETTSETGSNGDGDGDGGQASVVCEKDADEFSPSPATQPDPEHQHTVTGQNGSFTDECDADGNLLEYVCEVTSICDDPPNPSCTYFQTGDAVAMMFDCAGSCMDGICVARCPEVGDVVEYLTIAGDQVTLLNQTDGRSYDCVLSFDNQNDSYDCSSAPTVGATTNVYSLGLQGKWCTGTQGFSIGTGDPQQCTYTCTMIP